MTRLDNRLEQPACRLTMNSKRKRGKRKLAGHMADEAAYVCDACGEEVVIPVDVSQGPVQQFVEDCPVCCRPNVIHVEIDEGSGVRVWAEGD